MYKNIVFYNRWQNGDLFLSKGYMSRLMSDLRKQGPFNFYFAHKNNPKQLSDLDLQFVSIREYDTLPAADHHTVFVQNETVYINTWVGAYRGFFSATQEHANISMINVMWFSIFYTLQTIMGVKLFRDYQERLSPFDGIPTTDWNKFDIAPAKAFLKDKKNLVLFCNGYSMSGQTTYSNIHLMEGTVQALAKYNPNHNFVCSHKFNLTEKVDNVFFTDDIFANVTGGDINEIAYLSTFCDVIIGKSSGPHIYCHVKENLSRNCAFFTISDRQSDDYLYNFYDMEASHLFFVGKDESLMASSLHSLLNKTVKFSKFCVIDDEKIINISKPLDARNF